MAELNRPEEYQTLSAGLLNEWADEIERIARGVFSDRETTEKPVFRVAKTSTWIAEDGQNVVEWDTAEIDPQDMWDSEEPDRVTIRHAGVWQFVGQCRFQNIDSGTRRSMAVSPTNDRADAIGQVEFLGDSNVQQVVVVRRMDEGDTLYGVIWHNSGNDEDMITDHGGNYMTGVWLGP